MMIILLLLWGCSPSCERTCAKLVSCDDIESPEMKQEECESACNAQVNLYEDQDDQALQDAFDEHRSCILNETCDALAEGVCYDEAVYSF